MIHRQASPLIQVRIEYVDDIPRTAAGKHIFTRSDVWAQRGGLSRRGAIRSATCNDDGATAFRARCGGVCPATGSEPPALGPAS